MLKGKRWSTLWGVVIFLTASFSAVRPANAIFLDEAGQIQLSGVFYNQVRFRTENSRRFNTKVSDWNMLQHRYFVDPQLLVQVQPWLRRLPLGEEIVDSLQVEDARFFFNPRFEYDGIYDYGPDVFRDGIAPRLQKGSRLQLFEVYGDFRLFKTVNIRVGRQNLSWGETDIFRLLDRINPLDNGFGGFLTGLDERRRPLTMFRASIGFGDLPQWEVYNTALEVFIAPDKRLPAGAPGPTPWGVIGAPSPAGFPPTLVANLAELAPRRLQGNQLDRPDISLKDSRMGARLLWTWQDVSMSLAYLSIYPDAGTPALRLNRNGDPRIKVLFPNMQVLGFSATSPLSMMGLNYTVFRAEVAGFFDEPFFIEKQNFELGVPVPKRNVIRAALGFDHNQWLTSLNPTNTFFFTTQLFYTDIQGSTSGIKTPLQRKPGKYMDVDSNSFVQTLIANTTYSAAYFFNLAQVQPSVTYLYDWEGAWLLQPSITFVRNQWKFRVEYNNLTGRFYAGPGGGIGTLKDKDNLTFRIDYLL
ncbi:MAG: hypothetical protein HOP18_21075 [Deltaproteobacteria bacterium]|nr:hypothetical protein [Deltaproteobacteria bacterium]